MTRRVLVTGALGYLGGRVAASLAAAPDTRLVLGTRRPELARDLPFAVERVALHDLAAPVSPELCDGVDTIVHLAAPNEIVSARDPEAAIELTVNATIRLVARARESGVRRFIYVSTAHVYGAPLVGHLHERTLPRPRHPYAIAHRTAEDFVLAAARPGDLEPVVVRLSNGFGWPLRAEVDRWTLLVNDLCRQAVVNARLRLRSDGRQERDFVTLSDVARGVLHVASLPAAALGDGIFNLGGGPLGEGAMTVLAMAERIRARAALVLGFEPPLDVGASGDEPASEPLRYDCERLASTGFVWSGDIDAELDGTLDLCRRAFPPKAPGLT